MKQRILCLLCCLLAAVSLGFAGCTSKPEEEPLPAGQEQQEQAESLDLADLTQLSKTYLEQPFYAGVLSTNWTQVGDIDPGSLINFYEIYLSQENLELTDHLPAEDVEAYLSRYFELEIQQALRNSYRYEEETNTYLLEGLGGAADPTLIKASLEDDLLTLEYVVYDPTDGETLSWEGELAIRLEDGGGYKYISNERQYAQYPITQASAYLEEITKTYVRPLIPSGGPLYYSWKSPREIKADDLLLVSCWNNDFDLARNGEGGYLQKTIPAQEMEEAVSKRFGVIGQDYLHSSELYNEEDENYQLAGNFDGDRRAVALHCEEDGELLMIRVGLFNPDDAPDRPYDTALLKVEKMEDGFQYLSYELS